MAGLFALLRNEGGSVGTSIAQTIQERREQFHLSRLNENLGQLNPHVQSFMERGQEYFMRLTGDPSLSHQRSVNVLANIRPTPISSPFTTTARREPS